MTKTCRLEASGPSGSGCNHEWTRINTNEIKAPNSNIQHPEKLQISKLQGNCRCRFAIIRAIRVKTFSCVSCISWFKKCEFRTPHSEFQWFAVCAGSGFYGYDPAKS